MNSKLNESSLGRILIKTKKNSFNFAIMLNHNNLAIQGLVTDLMAILNLEFTLKANKKKDKNKMILKKVDKIVRN